MFRQQEVSSAYPGSQRASDPSSLGAAGRGVGLAGRFWLFCLDSPIGPLRPLPYPTPRFPQQLDRTLPASPTVLLHFARTSVSASHLSAARPVSLFLSRRSRQSALSLSPPPIYPSHFCHWSLVWFRSPDAFTHRCASVGAEENRSPFYVFINPQIKKPLN